MIIIAGALYVEPAGRPAYLAECQPVVQAARAAKGCRDFSLSADLVEPDRINVYERWESEAELLRFRGSGPSSGQTAAIRDARVERFEVSSVGPP
ncbi:MULTISPECIES: antibiotic biosynthesis monooxygenase family protein [unclassified Solwaraspora]|uniref:putative quinol monooxygenase n=1 Tax=unclassified Solwaraspora TaxID=2627926 RepID=UPI00248B8110|nr:MULTISPECIES: antibiotic biosynthesis monooxygenase family protein [unclassified Solwaraspora]WBB95692.1 antibiotic biosynthesis monooxygenase [Solwaraspora sp. WMMA2059]WBC20405.1 antibiotic biosynthesis monooxygenase [Solwaraspora sp. WMMA2080]WJK37441.1 antibiotic biosynthesis monooxygenase family protein [Solwaraspora sp. WMMA2065]